MKRYLTISFAMGVQIIIAAAPVCAESPATSQNSSLTVHVDKPGIKVGPLLYGIFFEEINHAGDGGLYAELVNNRSFENSDKPDGWTLVTDGSASAEMAVDTAEPMSENNSRSLRLEIKTDGGSVGVANEGYWGIAVVKDAQYEFSAALRGGNGFAGPVSVALESADGKTAYAQGEIDKITSTWKTFKLVLTSNASDAKARLVIRASKPGTLWLDMVSAFSAQDVP